MYFTSDVLCMTPPKKWTPFSIPATFFESKARDLLTLRSKDFE